MVFHHFGLLSGLGFDVRGPVDDPLQNVRLYWATHHTLPPIEIIAAASTPGAVSNLTKTLRQGVYHLCFDVSDLSSCLRSFEAHGRVVQVSPAKPAVLFEGRAVSFYFIENFGLVEFLEGHSPA